MTIIDVPCSISVQIEEQRKSLCCNKYVRKILFLIIVVLLCLIGGIVILKFHLKISDSNKKNLTRTNNSHELLKNSSSNNALRHTNECIVPKGCERTTKLEHLNISFKNSSCNKTFPHKNETIVPKSGDLKLTTVYPDICKNASFDAILSYKNEVFVLQGDWCWKITNDSLASQQPKLISQKWPGLPGNIDAAFTDYDDKYTYFFKGSQYWKFDGEKLQNEFPRAIATDFRGAPDNLQAASLGNRVIGELYFFKGNTYSIINTNKRPYQVERVSPITYWPGIPANLDAALRSGNSITYFFKGDRYYKYTEKTNQIVADNPPYPRSTASDWFRCPTL